MGLSFGKKTGIILIIIVTIFMYFNSLPVHNTKSAFARRHKVFAANRQSQNIEIIAHRGFSKLYPENTVIAAQKAVELGGHPECDVQFTKDNVMIVIHDASVDRTTEGKGAVRMLNYSYISTLDAGIKFSPEYKGTKIPTFDEYLSGLNKAPHIYPELKAYRTKRDVLRFTNTLLRHGFENRSTIISFDYNHVLPFVRQASNKIGVGALCATQESFESNVQIAKDDPNSMMLISSSIATKENLKICNDNGLDVAVWTINDKDTAQKLINIGYRKIISDNLLKDLTPPVYHE